MIHRIWVQSPRYIDDVISKVLKMIINIKFIKVRFITVDVFKWLPGNLNLRFSPCFHGGKVR